MPPLLPFIHNDTDLHQLGLKLLAEPTFKQSQTTKNEIANNHMEAESDDEHRITKFFVHHMHEQRFKSLKSEMHQVYNDAFENTSAMYTRMIMGTRNRRDMKNELIRKRPKHTLLQNTKTKREYYPQISG